MKNKKENEEIFGNFKTHTLKKTLKHVSQEIKIEILILFKF